MGAWGPGPFENDDAMDWTYELTSGADEAVVARALAKAADASSPSAPVASAAIAAAEVVAAGLGHPCPDLPADAAAWVADRADRDWTSLVAAALTALDRIAADSELAELWDEADDGAFMVALDELRERLGSAG